MSQAPVLIAGQWRTAKSSAIFQAENPATAEKLAGEFPVSSWPDCEAALDAAVEAAAVLRTIPPEQIAKFLTRFAERIEARKADLVDVAHAETALPKAPRLGEVELPRTTNQLRQAAAAAIDGSWAMPVIDAKVNIRSMLAPLGPVLIFGPNNFPFAYNGVAGGDFAAAIAAGNPVIAKAHPCHPGTTKLLAEEAFAAVGETGLPPATVQMIYHVEPADGLRMVADPRLGAVGFTGSRTAGLKLKAAADAVGKPIYLELSSLNPVVILPGALVERNEKIVEEFTGSCLMANGQFCTSPGLTILFAGANTEKFIAGVKAKLEGATPTTLLSRGVANNLSASVKILQAAGAEAVTGGSELGGNRFANTLLRVSGDAFLASPEKLQTEAFGNASLTVVVRDVKQALEVLTHLEGNLTGSIYSDTRGSDDAVYEKISPLLRERVGRLLNDKMPTGVAVSPAMNHGGPFPATGHPGFTAVGIPAAMRRFAMLQCFDNVRPHRLPAALRDKN
ncbi:MAG TPA: aldehyde dehydrogenase (NADP(+)) [Candidatus Acidoferrales bacterium]|jgi:alpha-ketoglutaric semialdehyde dehydrogenase|nr:aldehyde dehydrogenase (NADP(+)) [Candidatus Acidoferrales bacterium]